MKEMQCESAKSECYSITSRKHRIVSYSNVCICKVNRCNHSSPQPEKWDEKTARKGQIGVGRSECNDMQEDVARKANLW